MFLVFGGIIKKKNARNTRTFCEVVHHQRGNKCTARVAIAPSRARTLPRYVVFSVAVELSGARWFQKTVRQHAVTHNTDIRMMTDVRKFALIDQSQRAREGRHTCSERLRSSHTTGS